MVSDLEHAVSTLNTYAKQTKQRYFQVFTSLKTNVPDWSVPKNQRKAIAQLESILSHVYLKRQFYNFAYATNSYRLVKDQK